MTPTLAADGALRLPPEVRRHGDLRPCPAGLPAAISRVRKGFHTVGEMRGLLSTPASADLPAAERAGYIDVLTTAQAVYRAR